MSDQKIKAHKLEVLLDENSFNRVQEIKKKADLDNDAKLLSNAVTLYEWYLGLEEQGKQLATIQNGKVQKETLQFE